MQHFRQRNASANEIRAGAHCEDDHSIHQYCADRLMEWCQKNSQIITVGHIINIFTTFSKLDLLSKFTVPRRQNPLP